MSTKNIHTLDALGYSIEPLIELLIRDQLKQQNLNYIVELKLAS